VGGGDHSFKIDDKVMDTVYFNGRFLSRCDAKVSADDRGFQFADGVYEVVKYYSGEPFRLEEHLKRLRYSLSEIQIDFEGISALGGVFKELLRLNHLEGEDSGIYLQISRGAHLRVHHFPATDGPTVYAFVFPFPSFTGNLLNGIRVITAEDIRWQRCDIKTICLLPNSMLYNRAVEAGATECILVRNGKVTEATHSSVAGVKDGKLYTHPLTNLILPGITRAVMFELCRDAGIPVIEEAILADELCLLDELIVCGTGNEITPVVMVDEKPIRDGKPGPVTRLLQEKFFDLTGRKTDFSN
jgi:D-alanine transaminase